MYGWLIVVLFSFSAQAAQSCRHLPKDSPAFYACETLNQQERFERNRKNENERRIEEEKARRISQEFLERKREFNRLKAEYDRETVERNAKENQRDVERLAAIKEQEEKQIEAEIVSIIQRIQFAKIALEGGACIELQKDVDDLRAKIDGARPSYKVNGNTITRDDLEDAYVELQSSTYDRCLSGIERKNRMQIFLDGEAGKGNKAAVDLLKYISTLENKEAENNRSKSLGRVVPNFSDYGTDMASIRKYLADLDEVNVDACNEQLKNNGDAAYCLARHETGERMIAMLREASRLRHPLAANDLGMRLDDHRDPKDSAEIKRLITLAANSEIPNAQVTIGWWYMTGGHGMKIDYTQAMNWNLKAYKQGHSEGANNIGELYENALGVPKDLERAKSWYKRASVLGNSEATLRLESLSR